MGSLVSSTIPNLISGVSQQPWPVRLPTQAEEQVNCYSSVTDFLKRRPATNHVARLQADDTVKGIAAHSINRDEQEKYIVLASPAGVQVFDLAGKEIPVTVKDDTLSYLASTLNPEKDLRFLTINDYTFVLNRRVVVKTLEELSPKRQSEALVFIKQASYNTTYTITLDDKNYSFTTQDGVAPSDQPADTLSSKEIAENLAAQIASKTVGGVQYSGEMSGQWNGTLTGEYFVAGHTGANGDWVADKWIKGTRVGGFTAKGTSTFTGSVTYGTLSGAFSSLTFSSGPYSSGWRNCSFSGTFDGITSPELKVSAPGDKYVLNCSNSTIWIRGASEGDFKIKVEDSRSNTHISVCKGSVQRFSDLPIIAPKGFVTEIKGDATSSFDNYFCIFEPTDSNDDFGTGTWKETVAQGITYKLDPATLPHALVREADGTFIFKALEWGERIAGDDKSAPFPSFVDRSLGGMFFYRNRLTFLAGENVIMSEVGEFFNFFLTTVTTLIDSDVIDVAASSTRSSILEHACVFSGGLLLFSEQAQFVMEHDTVLSNATVSIKPVTEFEASMRAAPVSSGKTVFFATDKGEFGGVREYFTMPDASDQNDAADVTAHVPRYIRGGICKLACSTNEDILLVLSEQQRTSIWVYKYFWNGAEKIQSAWGRWDMAGEVLSAVFSDTTAYLVIRYEGEGLFLEALHFEPGFKDAESSFEYCLDRKITENAVTLLPYDKHTKTTQVVLPYASSPDMCLVTRPLAGSLIHQGALLQVESAGENTLTVKGNLHGVPFFVGLPFRSVYTFSTFAIRENEKGNAVTTGRLQLRNLSLNCSNTGFLELHITPTFRPTSVHTFTGRELGHGTNIIGAVTLYTGTVKCPILSVNTGVEVKAVSNSFLPFALVNTSWEGFYNSRHQRM